MAKLLNIAIIGCGRVAGHHARSIQKMPDKFRLVAVSDLVENRRCELAAASDVPDYESYHEMLAEHPEIDIVAVITPSGMHFEHALDIIHTFKKHVVIEKPVVMTLTQGRALEEAAAKNGIRIFPVFQYRFNKAVQRVKRAVVNDELGQLVLGTIRLRWCRPQRYYDRDPWRGTFALDGGACTNQGIHHLDLLRYLAGEVKLVNSKMKTFGAKIEVEDTVVATLQFASGALGVVEITTAARPDDFESSISVVGSKGLAMIGGWATNDLITFSPNPEEEKTNTETFPDVYGFGHTDIYLGVYDNLINRRPAAVEYADAIKSIRLLHAIYRSDEVGEWVDVDAGLESCRLGRRDEKLAAIYRMPQRVIKGS